MKYAVVLEKGTVVLEHMFPTYLGVSPQVTPVTKS